MKPLEFLTNWYKSQCDGDWEHSYGVSIDTLDNPGWELKVDLADTDLENEKLPYELKEVSENDWYGHSVKDKKFSATGDPSKLEFLMKLFQNFVENSTSVTR